MKEFLNSNMHRTAVISGLFLVFMAWVNAGVMPYDGITGTDLWKTVGIAAIFGLGLANITSYGFPQPNENADRIASRLLGVYQGAWFGGWMALVLGANDGWIKYLIFVFVSGGIFGVFMFIFQRKRHQIVPWTNAFDFKTPVDFDSPDGRWIKFYPIVILVVVTATGFVTNDRYVTSLIGAWMLLLVKPVFALNDTGIWKWVAYSAILIASAVSVFALIAK